MNTVKIAEIFADHMVMQQGIPIPVWGWAEKGEALIVAFSGQIKKTVADENGFWMVKLDPMNTNFDPQSMIIKGDETLCVKDILVGEVWICSGQSNMGYPMERLERDIDIVPGLRLFHCQGLDGNQEQVNFAEGEWLPADKNHFEKIKNFSIIGFLYGKELKEKLDVPIGVINISQAASIAESWTPLACLKKMVDYSQVKQAMEKIDTSGFNAPAYLYNNLVHPLIPFGIAGVLWYQGESSSIRSNRYAELMATMINSWRNRWNQGAFAFISVQLPNYDNTLDTPPCCSGSWQHMREAQLQILDLQNTALAVTIDIGESNDLHPANKPEVAHRLALAALGSVYAQDIVYSGPIYKSMEIKDNAIHLNFDHIGSGLMAKEGKLQQFEIAGNDKKFQLADAEINDSQIIVSSKYIKSPTAVRYGWKNDPVGCNLYNKEGLPASPFRT